MLSFSSNNPGIGTPNSTEDTTNTGSEPIIQEVYEEEPDDYNYVPPLREVDDAEIRRLSASVPDAGVDKRVYYACAAFLGAAIVGILIGYGIASVNASNANVQRKTSIARTIQKTVDTNVAALEKFKADFNKVASGNYSEASFDDLRSKVRAGEYNFMLDMSSDVTAEAVLLIEKEGQNNPLTSLRRYSADSMLLRRLIETHLAETRADSEAIIDLQSQSGKVAVTYAMQVIPDALYYLATTAPRSQYANGVIGIYTYRNVIEDDAEATEVYSNLKIDARWSNEQRARRDYKPKNKKEQAQLEANELDLPNHLIYEVVDRQGNKANLFADEVILVDRTLFFGESANAKERYDWRTQNIQNLLDKLDKSKTTIRDDLKVFLPDT